MSQQRSRFCVQFSGTQPHCSKKTRLLYNDSTVEDIRNIWKVIYGTQSPEQIEMIAGHSMSYMLNDAEDFEVFIAMAEDQYRLLPAKPLFVILAIPGEYRPSPPSSTPSPDRQLVPGTFRYGGKVTIKDRYSPLTIPKVESYESSPRSLNYNQNSPSPTNDYKNDAIENRMGHTPQDLSVNGIEQRQLPIDFSGNRMNEPRVPLESPLSLLERGVENSLRKTVQPPTTSSAPEVSSALTFVNNLQQQRILQNSPSASFILQTFLRNNLERAAAMQFTNGNKHNETKNNSILASTLNDYRLYNGNGQATNDTEKKRKRRSFPKSNHTAGSNGVSRVLDTSKRMRSSPTQSNIEYHYERAVDYHTMTEEEQKSHNSAHRSHWKHLLFVSQKSRSFLTTFRNAKYDEWSSEARDIYAISKPDKYKWSFLTLSKQGDVLCKRIIKRVTALKEISAEEKPDWCPTDETLDIAKNRAEERLAQLERILYSRNASAALAAHNQEKANELLLQQQQQHCIENIKPQDFIGKNVFKSLPTPFVLPTTIKALPEVISSSPFTLPPFSEKDTGTVPEEAC
nr:uncharacterized protein LOC100186892 [Ciona intestinalis]|eukprot:XP_018673479.1 uncharacterized protein LOC100186892 [Ciona intestinalis]